MQGLLNCWEPSRVVPWPKGTRRVSLCLRLLPACLPAWSSTGFTLVSSFRSVHSLASALFLCLSSVIKNLVDQFSLLLFRHNFSILYEYFSWIWVSDKGEKITISFFVILIFWSQFLKLFKKVYFSIRLLIKKPSCVQNRFGVFYWPIPWRVSFTFEVGFFAKLFGAAHWSRKKRSIKGRGLRVFLPSLALRPDLLCVAPIAEHCCQFWSDFQFASLRDGLLTSAPAWFGPRCGVVNSPCCCLIACVCVVRLTIYACCKCKIPAITLLAPKSTLEASFHFSPNPALFLPSDLSDKE